MAPGAYNSIVASPVLPEMPSHQVSAKLTEVLSPCLSESFVYNYRA